MTADEIKDRKKYIEEIRNSFPECGIEAGDRGRMRSGDYDHVKTLEAETSSAAIASGIRLRLFVSVLLFATFFAMQKNNTNVFGVSTEEVIDKIEENYDYTNLEKYVMMIFDSINL